MTKGVLPDFWAGKRVLLTGHTGFKGSWLSLWLQSMGAELYGFALTPPTKPNLFEVAAVPNGMSSWLGDIRDYMTVLRAVQECRPEIVIHMAAQPLVRQSYSEPVETFETNVMGTAHLLEAARQAGTVKSIVNVTTDKCYENKEWVWSYREDEPLGGHDPYSSSKACSELVTASYRRSFFAQTQTALASARAGNVIGGGDWATGRLLPDILRAWEKSSPAAIRNPRAIRPWQHVLEPLSGYLILAQQLYVDGHQFAQAWNFGPEAMDARPVQWIVESMARKWGDDARWQFDAAAHPHEASYLKLDIAKARHRLSWDPKWNLDAALDKVIAWHRAWLAGQDMRALCLQQIGEYQAAPAQIDFKALTT
jgi:CDP-glucose 4,6-dehydratase